MNYQMRPNGGDGWLRLLEFPADGKMVHAYDYSPTRIQRNEGAQSRFSLALAPIKKASPETDAWRVKARPEALAESDERSREAPASGHSY